MITICLDESGTFEGTGSAIKFIGGIIYTGDDYEEEKERLELFFRDFCDRNSIRFPVDLHAIDMNRNTSLKQIKVQLKQDLLLYLKQNGRYHLTCMLKSKQKRTDFVNISNLVHDDTASNLYEHMITQTLQNIIFYNPQFDRETKLVLEIATRSIPILKSNVATIHKYEELGYAYRDKPLEKIFYLTDQKTFKTALSVKIMESRIQRPIQVDLNVQRINYDIPNADPTPYLYVADLACDMIRELLHPSQANFNIMNAVKEIQKRTGNEPLFWAYDDIDGIWKRFYLACAEHHYIEALMALYELRHYDSPYRDLYNRHSQPLLQTTLYQAFDLRKLDIYGGEVAYLLNTHTRSDGRMSNTDMGIFIGKQLWEQLIQLGLTHEHVLKQQYKLADMLMRGYNHKGNAVRAREFYNYCQSNKSVVSPEDYCGTALSAAQILSNEFDFYGAIQIVEHSYYQLKKLKALYAEIASINGQSPTAGRYPLYGKVLSSLGQFYAFNREKEISLLFLEEALQEFEPQSDNYRMTVSFILHLAIDHKDRVLYERFEQEYYDVQGSMERFNRIVETQDRYQMYVWAKTLHVWPDSKMETALIKLLESFSFDDIKGFATHLHPWQLIYKYFALFMRRHGRVEAFESYKSRIDHVNGIGNTAGTIELINAYSHFMLLTPTDQEVKKKMVIKLRKQIDHSLSFIAAFADIRFDVNFHELHEQLENKFTFMYC